MAKIIRYCKMYEQHSGPNAFDVSRPNVMGNPYTHIRDRDTKACVKVKSRDLAIKMYEKYFDLMVVQDPVFKAEYDRMFEAYQTYPVIYIGCYCKPDETCHGDYIAKKLAARSMKAKIDAIRKARNS